MSGRHPRRRVWGGGALAARAACVIAAVYGSFGGCSLNQEGVRPPKDRIFFPGGATIESQGPAAGRWLYVVNSNSDLRYNAGTVAAVDLRAVHEDYQNALAGVNGESPVQARKSCGPDTRYVPGARVSDGDRCCWDYLDENILNCDEQKYVHKDSTVRIGSFGGRPVVQRGLPGNEDLSRMFVSVRGDVAINMFEVSATEDDVTFRCTGLRADHRAQQAAFATCEPNWRITREDDPLNVPADQAIPDDQVVRLPEEPYALEVDQGLALLYVGHLRGGGVSMIDLGCGGEGESTPELVQIYSGLLPGDANGSQGITSLTVRKQNATLAPIYATSRYSPVVGSFVVYGSNTSWCSSMMGSRGISIVGTGQFYSTGLPGSETRGIEFINPGQDAKGTEGNPDRAVILQRNPPALVAVDLGTQAPYATIEVCQSPTNLVQQTDSTGRTVALFVTCFDSGEVYVIDPWTPRLRSVIPVGRGPIATILPPTNADAAYAKRAYVVGFGANNVAVIDLDSTSRTYHRVIQRIGFSSPTPREVGPQ